VNVGNTTNMLQPPGALNQTPPVPQFDIRTSTGITAAEPPFLAVTPVAVHPGITIGIDGTVTLNVTYGRPQEQNFTVIVTWGDGTTSSFGATGTGTQQISHTFSLASIQANTAGGSFSQLGGTTFFAPTVTVLGDPSVVFVVAGQPVTATHQQVILTSPGLGLAGTDLTLFGSPSFNLFADPPIHATTQGGQSATGTAQSSFAANQSSPSGATAAATDRLVLRIVPTDMLKQDEPANDIDIGDDPNLDIGNLTTDALKVLFAKLPDGRYRIVWQRGTGTGVATERIILDVLLRDGKPINFDDLEKPSVPVKPAEPAGPALPFPAHVPADQAALDVAPAIDVSQLPDEFPLAAAESGSLSPPVVIHPDDEPSDSVDGRIYAGAGLPPALALVEMALLRRRRRNSQAAPASSAPPGGLTHAARLFRKLRQRSEQPAASSSEGRRS